ncbi:MAG: lysophospholipid acyltransferase family protein [Desulfobacteraceae bacterium]|jgi:1-acyl-sn-glycerol-3-phosphate acyltransferase|nr:lysophospholipid acyltransferase family protein [Desulfobacteraceae bacterium]
MNIDQFLHTLRTEFGYQSHSRPGFLSKYLPGLLSPLYYIQLGYTLFHSTFPARRGSLDRPKWAMYSHRCLKIVESVGGNVNISGLESVAAHQGPVVYIGNHMSLVETLLMPGIALAFSDVNFVIKEELCHYPILGAIFKALGMIAVSRKNPREDFKVVLSEGHKFISNGGSIIIFPQATRSVEFDVQTFNTLGVKLAFRAGVPVVPVAIKTDFHGNGKWIKDMGPINPQKTLYFKFGKALPVSGNSREVHQQVVEFIAQNLSAWGGKIKENAASGP